MYVTSSPATYAMLFTHAATPEQEPLAAVVVEAGAVVVVDVGVVTLVVVVGVEPPPLRGKVEPRTV